MKFAKFILFYLLFADFSSAEQLVKVVNTADGGIQSKVYFESVLNHIGNTDQNGFLKTNVGCTVGADVIAVPESVLYEDGSVRCDRSSDEIVVNIEWKPLYTNLMRNREIFLLRQEFGSAALVSNEIAARASGNMQTQRERVRAIEYLAKEINFPETERAVAFDPLQGREVATPTMVEMIKSFQRQKGLPITGDVDYRTLSTAAERDIGSAMYEIVE